MNWQIAELYAHDMSPLSRGGFDPWGPWIHAIEETGYFNHVIGKFNFWGLKAPKWWQGKRVEVMTSEFLSSNLELCEKNNCLRKEAHFHRVPGKALFMDFDDMGHAFRIYVNRVTRLYPDAFANRRFPVLFFEGFQNGKWKWSTNQNYVHAMTTLYNQLVKDKEHLEVLLPRIKEFIEIGGGA